MTANVHIFSQCKAQRATELMGFTTDVKEQKAIIKAMNGYLNTEYASVINKARTGKQFAQFMLHKDVMPNIEWLPSSATNPREAHKPYYHVVRPVDDPFWQENFPGNLWNCKCDWQATDKSVTDLPDKTVPPSYGLEGNPAITGEIFTKNASWIKQVGEKGREQAVKNIRKASVETALKSDLRDRKVRKQIEINGQKKFISIGFNRIGIKHFANDSFDNPVYKNLLLPKLDDIVKVSEFAGYDKNKKSEKKKDVKGYFYFKIKLLETFWLINIEERLGGCFLYALTKAK